MNFACILSENKYESKVQFFLLNNQEKFNVCLFNRQEKFGLHIFLSMNSRGVAILS